LSYFPRYIIGKKDRLTEDQILFNFIATFSSSSGSFREIAHSKNFEIHNEDSNSAFIKNSIYDFHDLKENIKISFRLENFNETRLIYQTSDKYPDHVAVMVSLLPTFTPPA
jgi:hypothetical protein